MRFGSTRSAIARATACAAALGLPACGGGGAPARPDVVLIVVDTLRADRTSLYGYPRPTTPVLGELASEGALFLDHSAQSSWTLPSMVSLFSGRYLTAYRDALDPDWPVIPESFRAAGYETLGISANILLMPENGFERGFEHYDARKAAPLPGSTLDRSRDFAELAADLDAPLARALTPGADGKRPPMFLFVQAFDPHDEYAPHPELDGELPLEGVLATSSLEWQLAALERRGFRAPADDPEWKRETRWIHWQRSLYDQEVRFTDAWIGKLVARLAELGVGAAESAPDARAAGADRVRGAGVVFALVSDHGEGLWDHESLHAVAASGTANGDASPAAPLPLRELFYQKHGAHLFEEAIRTPLLLWGEGIPRGVRIAAPSENVDLYPTLLELCALPVPGRLDGRSLVPLLDRAAAGQLEAPDGWRATTHAYVLHAVSVREVASGLKLILPTPASKPHGVRPLLFDLGVDPAERADLGAARSADAERLEALVARWTSANPTRSNLGAAKSAEQAEALEDLGYAGEHTGEDG